ncbi:flavin reductase family protein [Candidatus Tisiphia endosymbiont of Beris chalybata]|uniref:flavin reductase family protein n=1 Tax=Candidatus Tisiphia endosymbiont of Beris chalybata TaxID=3066262 RepID=UPI00312C980B
MASTVNIEQFKRALGNFPSGITIITTSYDNKLFGLTVSSFTSVSLFPPLILFCINKQAPSIKAFTNSKYFAVSILADNQAALSRHFAHHHFDKFASILYNLGVSSKCPLIDGAVCHIECNKFNQYSAGDHIIVIGEVINTAVNNELKPLIYHRESKW